MWNWTKDETWLCVEQNTLLNIMGDWVEPQLLIPEVLGSSLRLETGYPD